MYAEKSTKHTFELKKLESALGQAEQTVSKIKQLVALRVKRLRFIEAKTNTEALGARLADALTAREKKSAALEVHVQNGLRLDERMQNCNAQVRILACRRKQELLAACRMFGQLEATKKMNDIVGQRTKLLSEIEQHTRKAEKATLSLVEITQKVTELEKRKTHMMCEIAELNVRRAGLAERLKSETVRAAALAQAEKNKNIIDAYRRVIKPKGGIADILLERARADCEKAINSVLRTAGLRLSVQIDSSFEIRHGGVDEVMRPISLASGFQKFALGIATRIALWRLAAVPLPDCFVIDEGFSSCDDQNLEALAVLIEALATGNLIPEGCVLGPDGIGMLPRLVLLVTHIEALKNRVERPLTIDIRPTGSFISNLGHGPSGGVTAPTMAPTASLAMTPVPAVKRAPSVVPPIALKRASSVKRISTAPFQSGHPLVKMLPSKEEVAEERLEPDPNRTGNVWCAACAQSLSAGRAQAHLRSAKHANSRRR